MAQMIFPVVLTGGAGTRLWPVSRKSFPKQFQALGGTRTLFQDTLHRVQGVGFADPLILTGEDFRFVVQDQMEEMGQAHHAMLVEPVGRNTAPAILAAALRLRAEDRDAVMLIMPSDHVMEGAEKFRNAVLSALPAAQAGQIVTFGITPDHAETGYGYLKLAEPLAGQPVPLSRFVEKPDQATAQRLIASGAYLWNAGIFLCRADTMVAAFQAHAPDMIAPVEAAVKGVTADLGFERLAPGPWGRVADISIDYAIMEKAANLSVQTFDGGWSDLGSWNAIWKDCKKDDQNVAVVGDAQAIACETSLIYQADDAPTVVGLGLQDTIVVATGDAILVADKHRAQDVKLAVAKLKGVGDVTAEQTPRYHRPWGWYETLAMGGRFQVKRIVVKPGGVLSLQSHHHRAEHWVVVEGTARVTVDQESKLVTENESVYIPLGAVHRMENPGVFPMVLIEVQTGAYLAEDDIVRYEDAYNRSDQYAVAG